MYDIAIIGAGVTGCAVARELSRTRLKVALVEAAEDVAMGASRANSAIVHAGYDCKPGSLMAKMNALGNAMLGPMCEELDVPLGRCGSLVLAFEDSHMKHIRELYDFGIKNGVPDLHVIDGKRALQIEPKLNPGVVGALYAKTGGITCPYELTMALMENARDNGCDVFLRWPVENMTDVDGGLELRAADGRTLTARVAINAAGVHADDIARMAGDESVRITARKGEYMLLDRSASSIVYTVIFQPPTEMGKGILVSPTVHGNLFVGPTAVNVTDKLDTSTTAEGLDELKRLSVRSVPGLPFNKVITSFAGVRAVADTGDFIIRASHVQPKLILAAGICSPGLTSAPAIAKEIRRLVGDAGLDTSERDDFRPTRRVQKAFRSMNEEERAHAIRENALNARIVCRCETVTEAEIADAIKRGATTLDGVKRRTRAGMGRCQGGFCSPRVMEILSRETGIPMDRLTKFGGGSRIVVGRLVEVDE